MQDLIQKLMSRLHLSKFILADTLNNAFSFWFAVLLMLEMWSLKCYLWWAVKSSPINCS